MNQTALVVEGLTELGKGEVGKVEKETSSEAFQPLEHHAISPPFEDAVRVKPKDKS